MDAPPMIREIARGKTPEALLRALDAVRGGFTDPVHLLHCIPYEMGDRYCGVFGDGDMGSYEWFIWRGGALETSNLGYGSPEIALREVLKIAID